MTKMEMAVKIARAEGMMLGLYGIVRDSVIGPAVDKSEDSDLAILIGEQEQNLSDVYKAIEAGDIEGDGEALRLPGWMRRAKGEGKPGEEDEDRP